MKKFLSIILMLALLAGILPAALAAEPGSVILTAPQGVSLKVYTGFDGGSVVSPTSSAAEGGITTYTYKGISPGYYRYEVSGAGYLSVVKNFIVSESALAAGITIDADPGKTVPGGFQPTAAVTRYADIALETLLTTRDDAWANYTQIFDTPVFTEGRYRQQQTTQDEMMNFLRGLDSADDNLYLYSLGETPVFSYDVPIVVFTKTDLSAAKTLEEAAALVRGNGKSTIHYQSLIHPNEPASGEGCLAMIDSLDGDYGKSVLDTVNVYCIPRINGDGAHLYQRANVAQGVDMNRDHLRVQSDEVAMIHYAYNLFLPEVVIDGHEFNSYPKDSTGTLDDIQLGAAGSFNSSTAVNEMAQDMLHDAFSDLEALNLRAYHYPATVNNAIGRAYYGLYGSLSFLIETRGIHAGLDFFERRVLSQYAAAESFIDYVVANEEAVRTAVEQGRQELVEKGATYEDSDQLALKHEIVASTQPGYAIVRPNWNLTTGLSSNPSRTQSYTIYNTVTSSRTRPTAYVIPKGEAWAEEAVAILAKNGVSFYELEPGTAMMLQQYQGSSARAALTEEAVTEFLGGAYVFPMNQVGANVLAMTMEPDVADSSGYNGTLVQSGIVKARGGLFPIYRYIRDLNAQGWVDTVQLPQAPAGLTVVQPASEAAPGSITGLDPAKQYEIRSESDSSFTAVAAGASTVENLNMGVFYVRLAGVNGQPASAAARLEIVDSHITEYRIFVGGSSTSDQNHGRLETAPVATMSAAYEKLLALMEFSPEGTEGKIVLLGNVKITSDILFPAHDYPVVITGKDSSCGLSSSYNFGFRGETTLQNMTITLTTGALRYITANGSPLTVAESVITKPSGSYYYCICGGGTTGGISGGAQLTIHGGTWRNVYAAGHQGSINGTVRLTMTGGKVTKLVQPSYASSIVGTVIMDLSGVSVGGDIYCGNAGSKDIIGDVTLILGPGMTGAKVFAGSRDDGDVQGTVNIVMAGGKVSGITADAAKAENLVETVRITAASETGIPVTGDAVYAVDLSDGRTHALSDIPGTVCAVTGGGTLAMKSGDTLQLQGAQGVTTLSFDAPPAADHPVVTAPPATAADAFTANVEGKLLTSREENGQRVWYLKDAVTVTFLTQDTAHAQLTVAAGTAVILPEEPVQDGYTFTGWVLSDGTAFDAASPITADTTVTAGWQENAPEAPESPEVPEAPKAPEAPTRSFPLLPVIILAAAVAAVVVVLVILKKKKK